VAGDAAAGEDWGDMSREGDEATEWFECNFGLAANSQSFDFSQSDFGIEFLEGGFESQQLGVESCLPVCSVGLDSVQLSGAAVGCGDGFGCGFVCGTQRFGGGVDGIELSGFGVQFSFRSRESGRLVIAAFQ
jgi:hypothetical protein